MKRKARMSMGLVLAVVLALLAVGAAAAALLSAREVIEQSAVPMALENDTETRRIESYSHDQLVALVKAANENGITLDETTGIMQALRAGEGYWEDEAIMEICREAFGGLIDEWTYEEQYWFSGLMAEMNGYANDMPYPGENDLTAGEARVAAVRLLQAAYPDAKEIADPKVYLVKESFSVNDQDGSGEPVWRFTFQPLDLEHSAYFIDVDGNAQAETMQENRRDWSRFTVNQLEWAVNESYRVRTGTKFSWSQEAWHAFREMLPGAERDDGWTREYDAYLESAYPLPDAEDMTWQAARDIALRDAGRQASDWTEGEHVLLSDEAGRHLWKITGYGSSSAGDERAFWEIDAKTGDILSRAAGQMGDRTWRAYVLDAVYRKATEGMLTGEEALRLAADALQKELGEDIPYTDPERFERRINFMERRQQWTVAFRTKSVAFASGSVQITEPDHAVSVISSAPSRVDGDTLWGRYKQVYGASRWTQDIWVRFGEDMRALQPEGWEGKLLKKTGYPGENTVKMTREQAVDLAFAQNDLKGEEELDATLIFAQPHPVWKVVLAGEECIWLYEIDTETKAVLDREKYAPDNYEFDPPLKRYTLHRDFAPAYVEEFGPERLAVIEISKAFGDMTYDDPIATVLGADMDPESLSGESAEYTAMAEGHTVTIRSLQPGVPAYRVVFTEGWLTEKAEIITE